MPEQEFSNFSGARNHLETFIEIQVPKPHIQEILNSIGLEWGHVAQMILIQESCGPYTEKYCRCFACNKYTMPSGDKREYSVLIQVVWNYVFQSGMYKPQKTEQNNPLR